MAGMANGTAKFLGYKHAILIRQCHRLASSELLSTTH